MLVPLAACTPHRSAAPAQTAHTPFSFSELPGPPDNVALTVLRAKELLFRIGNGEIGGEAAQNALDALARSLRALQTDAAIAYVYYCRDVTDEARKATYDALETACYELGCVLNDAGLLLMQDPVLSGRYDAETERRLRRADALSDLSLLPLIERERALIGAYETLESNLTVTYGGRVWTGDAILNDPTLAETDFPILYETYLSAFNREAGKVFLDLAAVRGKEARALGFDSYVDSVYASLDRDFTPEQAAAFCARVKRFVVPVFVRERGAFLSALGRLYGVVCEPEPTFRAAGETVGSLVPSFSDAWDYMIVHGMYDVGTEEMRMPGSFTTYFPEYGAPFLFATWSNGYEMPSTLIHEFGHYAAFYEHGERLLNEPSPDLAEIDSQGLELLAVLRYDTLYGELAGDARTVQTYLALYTLVSGCLEDEFQRFAYSRENLTLETLNAEYGLLVNAYGLSELGAEARSWTQIPHTFQTPLYDIGYALGMTAALELYSIGRNDEAKAIRTYRAIFDRKAGEGFRAVLARAGLHDPFAPEWEKSFSETLESVYGRQIEKYGTDINEKTDPDQSASDAGRAAVRCGSDRSVPVPASEARFGGAFRDPLRGERNADGSRRRNAYGRNPGREAR